MTKNAHAAIERAAATDGIVVSAASAWEVGMLASKGRAQFVPDPKTWFRRFVGNPAISVVPLTAEAMLDAWYLPDWPHADPADRLLVAAARELNIPIITRDRVILAYAATGHCQAISC